MYLGTVIGIISAVILGLPLLFAFGWLLFKKDEGEECNSAKLIWLKIVQLFTFDKAKREALKDELWVKAKKAQIIKENHEATSDIVEWEDDEQTAMVLAYEKEQAKLLKAKEAKKTTTKLTGISNNAQASKEKISIDKKTQKNKAKSTKLNKKAQKAQKKAQKETMKAEEIRKISNKLKNK